MSDLVHSRGVILACTVLFLVPLAGAGNPLAGIDLTDEGAVGRSIAQPTIIDTRTYRPQIQFAEPWTGPVTPIRKHLPGHDPAAPPPIGQPNDQPVGGLIAEARGAAVALFPGIGQTPWIPPDLTLAVGLDHIVQTVNMQVAFYTKAGELEFSQRLDSSGNPGFFGEIGAGGFTFDPKCFYDQYAGRFVIVALEVYDPNEAWIDIAVSDDDNPNGIWYKYRTWAVIHVGGADFWVDYPGVGYDEQAYYITGNLFQLGGGGGAGTLYRIFDKVPMLAGQPVTFSDLRNGSIWSTQVAHCHGATPVPYFVAVLDSSQLRVSSIGDPLGTPVQHAVNLAVPTFDYPSGDAPNLNGSGIWALDGRIMNVHWRDGNLYVAHSIGSGGKNVARWYHIHTNGWPATGYPSLVESGNVDPGGDVHTFYPAIYSSERSAVGMVMARSSPSEYASVAITGRKPSDPPGTMGALLGVKLGQSGYSGWRWGDYFDVCVDPADDNTFWVVGEYAVSGVWATWITSFFVTPALGDMNCDGHVNAFDIDPFVLALVNPAGYATTYPNCDLTAADVNQDGAINAFDIDPFVARLTGK